MMRETSHLCHIARPSVITLGECDTQYFRRRYRIVAIGFIEVTATKQQYSIRVLLFKGEELLHHWGQPLFFLCHFSYFNTFFPLMI